VARSASRPELAIVSSCLIDTGPLVAYLDANDRSHSEVALHLDAFAGRLVTTSAVITESMHFVSQVFTGPRMLCEFVSAGGLEIFDLSRPPELNQAVSLMEKYADTPMDFADATLVLLAEGLETGRIFTLDRRGFSTYRTRPGRSFELLLDL
jgi:predicted nucleic acid-binding protein